VSVWALFWQWIAAGVLMVVVAALLAFLTD